MPPQNGLTGQIWNLLVVAYNVSAASEEGEKIWNIPVELCSAECKHGNFSKKAEQGERVAGFPSREKANQEEENMF